MLYLECLNIPVTLNYEDLCIYILKWKIKRMSVLKRNKVSLMRRYLRQTGSTLPSVQRTLLEELIMEQKNLIDILRNDLKLEKENSNTLKDKFNRQEQVIESLKHELDEKTLLIRQLLLQKENSQKCEEELSKLKLLLSEIGIESTGSNSNIKLSMESYKSKIENDLSRAFTKTLHDFKINHEKELEDLEQNYGEIIKSMREDKEQNQNKLEQQIASLTRSLIKHNESLCNSDVLIERPNIHTLLRQFNTTNNHLSPNLSALCDRLAETIEKEISVRSQVKSRVEDDADVSSNKLIKMRDSVCVCKLNLVKDNSPVKGTPIKSTSNLSKLETILNQNQIQLSSEIESVINYTEKIKKCLKETVEIYDGKLNQHSVMEKFLNMDCEDNGYGDNAKPNANASLMTDIKQCHKFALCLNEIIKTLDNCLVIKVDENQLLNQDFEKLKNNYIEKIFSLESQIKLLNEKILIILEKNKSLETNIFEIKSTTVPSEKLHDLNDRFQKLYDVNMNLESEVERLTKENRQLLISKSLSDEEKLKKEGTCVEQTKLVQECEQHLESDSCTSFSSLTPNKMLTSTPYQRKEKKIDKINLLKSTLIEWIEKYNKSENQKEQLEIKIKQFNAKLSRSEFMNDILQQEINILRNNNKNLQNTVRENIDFKEKIYLLENENNLNKIKLKFLNEIHNNCGKNICTERADETCPDHEFPYNVVNQLVFNRQVINNLEMKLKLKQSLVDNLSVKIKQAEQMNKLFEYNNEHLFKENQIINDKLIELTLDKTKLSICNKMLEIQLKSVKEELNGLIWSVDRTEYMDIINQMKEEAMNFLKGSIDEWCSAEIKCCETGTEQVDKLDARHRIEILIKNNNLLENDKEELLLKLSELQHEIHSTLKTTNLDSGWLVRMDKYEAELLKEIQDERDQHARIEEALRSTGKLHDDLQKQYDLYKIKIREMQGLKKSLVEEKHRSKCFEDECKILKKKIKDKDVLLQESLDARKRLENDFDSLSKESARKQEYENKLIRAKWMTQFKQDQSTRSKMSENLLSIQRDIMSCNDVMETARYESMEAIYQQSIETLRYYMEQEKAFALAAQSRNHSKKVL